MYLLIFPGVLFHELPLHPLESKKTHIIPNIL